MDNELLIKEIEYYQFYLGKALSQIYINDKICDFYENNNKQFSLYANSLSEISSALLLSQRMLFCDIFLPDRDSKNIHKLLNKLQSNKIATQEEIDLKIKNIAESLANEVALQSTNLDNLQKYRHNVFAHFNTRFFDDDWRKDFPHENRCDFIEIKNLAIKVFDGCSQILQLLKRVPLSREIMMPFDINTLIKNLSQ